MTQQSRIIDVDPIEARDWIKDNPSWEFHGKVNNITPNELTRLVHCLYDAGCKSILITDYEWEIEPVYEGDQFHPNMLLITLPNKSESRKKVFKHVNNSYSKYVAKTTYKDTGSTHLWYFFEPEPQKIKVGNREISWYS